MSFDHVTTTVKQTVLGWWDSFLGRDAGFKYTKELTIGLGILCLAGLGYGGHSWYAGYRERSAQKQFGVCLSQFTQARKENTPFAWQQAASLFRVGYEQHSSSYMGPYFLVYQSEAQFKSGNQSEAIATLDKAIQALPSNSPFINLYKTKRALMLIDMDDESSQSRGVQELEQLSNDASNMNADVAQFYLGRFYWVNDRVADAKMVWTQLVESQKMEKLSPSPWAAQAAQLLETVA